MVYIHMRMGCIGTDDKHAHLQDNSKTFQICGHCCDVIDWNLWSSTAKKNALIIYDCRFLHSDSERKRMVASRRGCSVD